MDMKKLPFFVVISLVGGLIIGIAVGTDISPVISGLIGAIIIFVVAGIFNFFGGKSRMSE
jgi:hypothetical protein